MNNIDDLSNLQPTDLDAGQVFSGKPSGTTVRGYAVPSAYTPAIADHVLVLGEGRALFSGSLAELEANDDPYLRQFLLREPGDTQAAMGEAPDPAVRQALDRWLAS